MTQTTVCEAVKGLVFSALEADGAAPAVSLVVVGQVTVDDCCAGMLAVAPERVFRTVDPFPQEAIADGICHPEWIAVALVVSVFRCVPTLDSKGRAPKPEAQQAAYDRIMRDAAIAWNVCAGAELLGDDGYGDTEWERASVSQDYIPATGGCIGVETRLTLGIPFSWWCTDLPDPS